MLYVIVKENGKVIGKEVYAGDDLQNASLITDKQEENPSLTYTVVDMENFDATPIQNNETQEQGDWKALTTPEDKMNFLAKKLGLE